MLELVPEVIPTVLNPQNAWIDFSKTDRIQASGNEIVSSTDLFNNGNNLSQATSINRPKTGIRTLNGLNVADFNGVSQSLSFPSNKVVSQPFTIFVVAQVDATTSQTIIGRQTAAIAGQWTLLKNPGFPIFQTYGFGSGGIAGGGVKTYNSNPNIHTVSLAEGSTVKYQLNNDTIASDNIIINGYDNNVPTTLAVGSSVGISNFLDGAIGEIIIYGYVLSANQIAAINRYLSRKWGIAIS